MRKVNNGKAPNGQLILARRIFTALALVLRQQGTALEDIRTLCIDTANRAESDHAGKVRIPLSKDSALLGSALALWFRDSRFLDAVGMPKPLRAYGRSPSVESLLRAADMRRHTKESVRFLTQAGLIVPTRSGKFVPTNRSARIPSTDAYFVEHIAQGVMKLIQTAHFNFTPKGRRQPLLQRAASIRKLPRKHRAAFRDYVAEQGNAFVTNIDDWLEARAIRPNSRRDSQGLQAQSTSAGVYAFAYID